MQVLLIFLTRYCGEESGGKRRVRLALKSWILSPEKGSGQLWGGACSLPAFSPLLNPLEQDGAGYIKVQRAKQATPGVHNQRGQRPCRGSNAELSLSAITLSPKIPRRGPGASVKKGLVKR